MESDFYPEYSKKWPFSKSEEDSDGEKKKLNPNVPNSIVYSQ